MPEQGSLYHLGNTDSISATKQSSCNESEKKVNMFSTIMKYEVVVSEGL
jgi:hypothetical protein